MLRAAACAGLIVFGAYGEVAVTGRVVDENGAPVAGARVVLRGGQPETEATAVSDIQGRFSLELGQPGRYQVRAERPGFFKLEGAPAELSEGSNEISVTLNHLRELAESLDVVYSAPSIDPAETNDRKQLDNLEVLAVPYPASQDVRSALPLFQGVVQDTRGQVHFNGGASDQVSYSLDEFNIADPVTGTLEARLNIDAVRSLELESGRFSAATGRGSSGALNLETGMGDDRFRFGATNFIPSVSTERGLALSKWTPRLTFSGPIKRSRAWFHNALDAFYDLDTIAELPRGQDRSRDLTGSNLSRLQLNLTPSTIFTGSYLINYIDRRNKGLSMLEPLEATVNRRQTLNMAAMRSQSYLSRGYLLEFGFAASRVVVRESPQGTRTYEITPAGRRGNYFVDLARLADRQQWLATVHFPALEGRGRHLLRIGADLQRSGFTQHTERHDYRVLRNDWTVAREVSFIGEGLLQKRNFETALYMQDAWTIREGLTAEIGLRLDWDQIVRNILVSPRIAVAWLPGAGSTKISAGFGIYNDALNLLTLSRHQDQSSITIFYPRTPQPPAPPVLMRFQADEHSLESPRARLYSLGLEQRLPGGFVGKLGYLRRVGIKGFTFVDPSEGLRQPRICYQLSNQRTQRYDALEFAVNRSFARQFHWMAGYTYSRARSNAVVEYSLENPVFSRQAPGRLEWDVPHRFLSWGWAPVPRPGRPAPIRSLLGELSVNYLLEARSGFPFSLVNEENFAVGPPNSRRLPNYFNLNLHFEKKFRFMNYMWAWRFGLNNLTNHGNPNVVNNNVDSPFFLTYGRGQQRAWNVRLRFLGRK